MPPQTPPTAPPAQVPQHHQQAANQFLRLLTLMDQLRENCPWDRAQTFRSLRHLTLEEAHELTDAILDEDWPGLAGELGDLFLHLVFYARLGREAEYFELAEVLDRLCAKLVRRHPHIYGDGAAQDAEAVKQRWEAIKLQEGGRKSVLKGVPPTLPALLKAYRMQEKAAGVGFDWPDAQGALEKVQEELNEVQQEVANGNTQAAEAELGDLLFSLVNAARHLGLNPEDALEGANRRFRARFGHMEAAAEADGQALNTHSLDQLEARWQAAKAALKLANDAHQTPPQP